MAFMPRGLDWGMGDRLNGKNILVTGSGRGCGQSMAVAYATEVAHVMSTARAVSELQNTEHVREAGGVKVVTGPCDLTDDTSIHALVNLVDALGGLDVLVNNAATSPWLTTTTRSDNWWIG